MTSLVLFNPSNVLCLINLLTHNCELLMNEVYLSLRDYKQEMVDKKMKG